MNTSSLIEPLEARIAPAALVTLNLSSLDGKTGFKINGEAAGDYSGLSVSAAGDVNGDGFADLLIGGYGGGGSTGASYVVFGKAGGFTTPLNLSTLNGANGFKINGEAAGDESGISVSAAGDVNGDGFADLLIGAFGASPNGAGSGASYVVLGKPGFFSSPLNLSTLNGAKGFKIRGEAGGDNSGRAVSAAGDVNGDGVADLLIGAVGASPNGAGSGASYVLYGHLAPAPPPTDTLVSLDATGNLVITDVTAVGHADLLTIRSDINNSQFKIIDPNANLASTGFGTLSADMHTLMVPFSLVTGAQISVSTQAGDDTVTLDFSDGPFSKAINIDGGLNTAVGDKLVLAGAGNFTTIVCNYTDAQSGSISVAGGSLISHTGVEFITSQLVAENLTLNYGATAETINVADLGGGKPTASTTAGATTTFVQPASSLSINAGGGDDTVNINSFDPTFHAALSIDGEGGLDTVNLAAGLPPLSSLKVTTETIGALPGLTIIGAGGLDITTTLSGIDISGDIAAAGHPVSLHSAAAITNSAGTIVAQNLTADAATGIALAIDGANVQAAAT